MSAPLKMTIAAVAALLATACVYVPYEGGGGKAGGGGTVLVCHKGKKTLELPREAVQSHLDHGDRVGPC